MNTLVSFELFELDYPSLQLSVQMEKTKEMQLDC